MQGKFIVFEGPDGSGQSTQARFLKDYLERKGYSVLLTKEPTTESEAGKKIAEVLKGKAIADPAELQELFVEDRNAHLENTILPALAKGKIVISDRYFFSTIAFGSLECDKEWLIQINKEFPLPDVAFILEVSPEVCVKRINKRGKGVQFFEKAEKLRRVLEAYKELPSRFPNVHMVNGEQSIRGVFRIICERTDRLLSQQ